MLTVADALPLTHSAVSYPRLSGSSGKYPYRHGRHLKVVVDLFVYADESGTQRSDVICLVGGHIGSPRQWGRLNGRWRTILASEHVEEFHARDFFTRRVGGVPTAHITAGRRRAALPSSTVSWR